MIIRRADRGDAAALAAIHGHYVRDTLVTFTTEVKSTGDWRGEICGATPVFVAEEAGKVLGYGTFSAFRAGPGYAATAEHSVYLAKGCAGRGIGRALMNAVERAAAEAGIDVLIAGISGANPDAVSFHKHLGYVQTGRLEKVGRKQGQKLDLVLMQKNLPPHGDLD